MKNTNCIDSEFKKKKINILFNNQCPYLNKFKVLKSDVFNFSVMCFYFCSVSKVAEYFVVFNKVFSK